MIPSAEEIQELLKDIETFAEKIEKYTLMLSSEERQRTTNIQVPRAVRDHRTVRRLAAV